LFADAAGRLHGVEVARRDGTRERFGCAALILACNGYGGNPDLVRRFIPEMAEALYFGHPGNRGDAVLWGEALGAELACLGAYQGHGSVATPHNILISWAVIMEGGIQVNTDGRRFCDETRGYSEQAAEVLRQPHGMAWDIFDARIAGVARQFEDFQAAERAGAILVAATIGDLAAKMHVPADALAEELENVETLKTRSAIDRFGRQHFSERRLSPPYCAVRVTGALFHTQGGVAVDVDGRVKRKDGALFPNLFAAGGAAVGLSGRTAAGYLSGNGLLNCDGPRPFGGHGCGCDGFALASSGPRRGSGAGAPGVFAADRPYCRFSRPPGVDQNGLVVRRLEAPAGDAVDPPEPQAVLLVHDPFRLAAEDLTREVAGDEELPRAGLRRGLVHLLQA
jgi:fumarate reductase flavoprotein subunit